MAGIGDTNARYYTAAQYLEYLNIRTGAVVGVGVDVVKDSTTNYARVIRVYADSPAEEAGITKNWYITKIDGASVQSMSADRVASLLSGEAGTSVTLTALNVTAEEQTVTIQRRQYDTPSIEWQMLGSDGIGYVRIVNFVDSTNEELSEAIDEMKAGEGGLAALIVDVRNNTGGTLDNAVEVIDALCPVGPIASRLNSDGTKDLIATSDVNEIDVPVVVLTNGSTAAGAELLAASVRAFDKGRIVGTVTAGKGSIQCDPVRLSNGAAVSYTVGMLLTGFDFGFFPIAGWLGLLGMIVKNVIVLIDEINAQHRSGASLQRAIIEATVARTRPVLMAAITTIAGMIPLLFDIAFGGMAATIIFGLTFATGLTLFVTPVLYALFYRVKIH